MEMNRVNADKFIPEPYLHIEKNRIYNPLTDRAISYESPLAEDLRSWVLNHTCPASLTVKDKNLLLSQGWLIKDDLDQDSRFHLMYVSLETHTLCNQKCYFCPVSVAPRDSHFMSRELFHEILKQLREFRATLRGVFLHNYNEPTLSPNFISEVESVLAHELPVAVNTNGSGLTPVRVDELRELGGLNYLSINLSTLNAENYFKTRGQNHLSKVMRNVDYIAENQVAKRMDIAVLGQMNEKHADAYQEIKDRYGKSFNVNKFAVNDRSGNINMGMSYQPHKQLAGCDLMGSRLLQHLHIDSYGKCIMCCQDYAGNNVLGDINQQSILEILSGSRVMQFRRWVYGRDEANEDFICRQCEYALTP